MTAVCSYIPAAERLKLAEGKGYDFDAALVEIEDMIQKSELAGQYGPANGLLKVKIQMCGFLSERIELEVNGPNILPAEAMAEASKRDALLKELRSGSIIDITPAPEENIFD